MKKLPVFLATGLAAFLFGLLFLYVAYDFAGVPYLIAVPLSALLAASVHYQMARTLVFRQIGRSWFSGYALFMSISVFVALFITVGVYVCVEFFHMNVYISRVAVALLGAVWSFFTHQHFTFGSAYAHRVTSRSLLQ